VCGDFGTAERNQQTYDIFEGTEQIQQLVIARAIRWAADRVATSWGFAVPRRRRPGLAGRLTRAIHRCGTSRY
jgi:hypothetical protein